MGLRGQNTNTTTRALFSGIAVYEALQMRGGSTSSAAPGPAPYPQA